jgi:hypothetical protein
MVFGAPARRPASVAQNRASVRPPSAQVAPNVYTFPCTVCALVVLSPHSIRHETIRRLSERRGCPFFAGEE